MENWKNEVRMQNFLSGFCKKRNNDLHKYLLNEDGVYNLKTTK